MCGESEIFSLLLDNKRPLFSITAGYKNNTFYLKKYYKNNSHEHPRSCSKKTIKLLKTKISKQKIEWVKNEILFGYKRKNLGNFFKNSNKLKIGIKK